MSRPQFATEGFASDHDMYHNPTIDGPVDGCDECKEALGLVCEGCGNSEDGLHLAEYTDEGDPSVGYGPITMVFCDVCAKEKGLR